MKDANLIVKAENDKYRRIGKQIVATESRTDSTVRDVLVACKGYTPSQIEMIKEGVTDAYTANLDALYNKVQNELDLPENFSGMKQAIYNRRSEKLAILEAFRLYASFTKDESKFFDNAVNRAQSYHALVSLCRSIVKASKEEKSPTDVEDKTKSVSSRGFRVTLERVERMTKEQLQTLIAKANNAIKKFASAPSNVYAINKARKAKQRAADLVAMKSKKAKVRKAA